MDFAETSFVKTEFVEVEFDWNDPLNAVPYDAEEAEKEDKARRKKYRREMCGKIMARMMNTTGEYHHYISRCKQYKECPLCREWKKSQERTKLESQVDRAYFLTVSKEQEKEISSKLEFYERIPNGLGKTTFIWHGEVEGLAGQKITQADVDELTELAVPVDNRRKSIKKPKAEEWPLEPKKEDSEEIHNQDKPIYDGKVSSSPLAMTISTHAGAPVQVKVSIAKVVR